MSDFIETLPVDNEPLSYYDSHILNDLLKSNYTLQMFINEIKDAIVVGILFVLMTLSKEFIDNTIPYAKSSYLSSILFRAVFIAILFQIYQMTFS